MYVWDWNLRNVVRIGAIHVRSLQDRVIELTQELETVRHQLALTREDLETEKAATEELLSKIELRG